MHKDHFDAFANALRAGAKVHGIAVRVVDDAISLLYIDGCDSAFWGRNEKRLANAIAKNGPEAIAEKEIAAFRETDAARRSVLIGFRYFAHRRGICLRRSCCGEWTAGRRLDMCEVEVGWRFTESLRCDRREEALRFLAYQTRPLFASKAEREASRIDLEELNAGLESLAAVALPQEEVAELLAQTAPPAGERSWWEDDPQDETDLAVDDDPLAHKTAAHWQQPPLSMPPRTGDADFDAFCAVLLLKASRHDIVSHCLKDAVSLRYSDGCDAALWERSEQTVRRSIRELGPSAVADRAFAEFQEMDRKRMRVLTGFRHWAAQSRLYLERRSSGVWECGNDLPEVVFVNRRLTERIRLDGESAALRSLMPKQFLGKEARRLRDKQVAELLAKTCPPSPESEQPPAEESIWDNPEVTRLVAEHARKTAPFQLPGLDEYRLDELDSIASRAVEQYKRRLRAASNDDNWLWPQPLWYQRPGDAWIDESWWIETATRKLRRKGNICALETLLANGRDEFRPLARKWIDGWVGRDCPRDHEWQRLLAFFYPKLPVAKSILEDGRSSEERALLLRLGHLPSRHFFQEGIAECLRDGFRDEAIWRLTVLREQWARRLIDPQTLDASKEYGVSEAGRPMLLRRRHEWLMRCAVAMNWPEIADALADNPAYLPVLFGRAVPGTVGEEIFKQALIKRGIKFDPARAAAAVRKGPSCYDSNHFQIDLLAWSLVRPGEYAGRLAAKALSLTKTAHPHPDDVLAAAIAWKRARACCCKAGQRPASA